MYANASAAPQATVRVSRNAIDFVHTEELDVAAELSTSMRLQQRLDAKEDHILERSIQFVPHINVVR